MMPVVQLQPPASMQRAPEPDVMPEKTPAEKKEHAKKNHQTAQ
jgi:hypothetical protein